MSSSIFFRFKSRKDALQINFDGTSLSVFEVKREIMSIARLGDGKDFDLDIYTSDTNELYDDDTTQIPRSTTVIARRLPAQRPGAGRAARYVTGHMPLHARNSHRVESSAKATNKTTASNGAMGDGAAMTEEEKLKAVLNASNNQLKADLQNSAGKPVIRNKAAAVPDKPLPPGYMCHRCGKPGHWIQACPTNNDPNFDGKHKFKRTTGIPKSFHVALDTTDAIGEDGQVDPTKLGKGAMYTSDGHWVRAKTDEATWQKIQEQQAAQAEKAREAAQGDEELRNRGLECPIDKRPFVEPHKTPCCGKTYCLTCIENSLLDNDLLCPNCGEQALIDKLEPDDDAVKKLAEYEDEKKAERLRKDEEASKSPAAGTPKAEEGKSPGGKSPGKSPSAAVPDVKVDKADSPASTSSNSKKRPAEEELENKRRPSNPAEMKKTTSNQGTPAGPSQSTTPQPQQNQPQPPKAPKSMTEFVNQMNQMAGGMPNGPNGMPGFNPMMNGMDGMNGMGPINMNMMNMMAMGMMPPNFNNMNMMNQMGGGFPPNMNGMGMNGMNGGMGWQGNQQQQQPWMRNGNMQQQGGDGAYFRQPVNPHRAQGRQRRQRSVDYKQM